MSRLTPELRAVLCGNAAQALAAEAVGGRFDTPPLVKLFNPVGVATWLATELYSDNDTLFGLADLGFGCPELGTFSLAEISAVRLPFGLSIECDLSFSSETPLSVWADIARRLESISAAEQQLLQHPRRQQDAP